MAADRVRYWIVPLALGWAILGALETLCAQSSPQPIATFGIPAVGEPKAVPDQPKQNMAGSPIAGSTPGTAASVLGQTSALSMPTPDPRDRPLPINLATALALVNTRPLDVAIAAQQIRTATAKLNQANVLWLPSIQVGGDYLRHDGRLQDPSTQLLFDNDRSTLMVGGGPTVVFAVTDAIFEPLAARQNVNARQAALRTATNDTFKAVAEVYFDVQQARGEVAGAEDAVVRATKVVRVTEALAPGLIPALEISRARAERDRRKQVAESAWERWRVASAELTRVLRLDAAAIIEPLESPQLQIALISPDLTLDELMPVALTTRPELASQQALVQAALARWRQEKLRPFLPSLLVRGASTNPGGSFGMGVFGGGANSTISNFGARIDYDFQLVWQLDNLGFGYKAKVDERRSDHEVSYLEFARLKDRIVAEVAQALAQLRSATARAKSAESELKEALNSAEKNFASLKEAEKIGKLVVLVVRPQEAVASVQALGQAYFDYYGSIADFNRAEFRLYRALGNPANYPFLGPGLDQINRSQSVTPPGLTPPPPAQKQNALAP